MAERCNAISELARFWLQARHHCLLYESLPVPVRYNQSDIDFLAIRGNLEAFELPNGCQVGPSLIVETKDEHDWEPLGKEFAQLFAKDLEKMKDGLFVSKGTACKFSMLREEHYEEAKKFFGSDDFDRLFIFHAFSPMITDSQMEYLRQQRIHIITIKELVNDLCVWYSQHPRRSGLRHTLTGDLWHLLVGFCGCKPSQCLIDKTD